MYTKSVQFIVRPTSLTSMSSKMSSIVILNILKLPKNV